ncbi:MAG: LuxR C-terminal-related transcriptional regulator [Chloroflexi bacterium OHK40]
MMVTLAPSSIRLAPPPAPDGSVPRARLLARLAAPAPITVLVAPAGFGKTTLLSQWLAAEGERVASAWVTLDERDNDPVRFWSAVLGALDRTAPGVSDHARSMLESPTPPSLEVVVGAAIDELQGLEGERVLVLDDYHLISVDPIHAAVAELAERLPPGLRLLIASRAEPPLPLARWRVRGTLAELRAADLRLTPEEVHALLQRAGVALDAAGAAALAARTEGWAAAATLAARSLRHSPDPQASIAAFAGRQRHLYDFLADEVLRRQPPLVQCFLLDTSILGQLSAELCDALRDEGPVANAHPTLAATPGDRPSSQQLLETIEAQGLFLLPLDDERRWYRYHGLFAEFLRERLQRDHPGRPALLHQRAAAWYNAHGLPDEAVEHLLAAGDAPAAAAIVEREGRPVLLRSEVATVLRWVAALPAEQLRARPALRLIEAWARALAGQFEAVEPLLQDVEALLARHGGDPDVPTALTTPHTPRNLTSEILAVRATVAGLRRETARAIELAQGALAALPAESVAVRGVVQLILGTAAYLQGDLAMAAPALEAAVAAGQGGGMPIIAIFALRLLGELQARAGQLHRAARTYEDAIARGAALYPPRGQERPRPVPVAGAAYLGYGLLRYEWNDLDAAEALLRDALRLGRQGANAEILLMAPIGLARVQRARGDGTGARATIAEALAYARATGVPRLANWLAAEQARLELAIGDLAAAAAWDQGRRLDPADPLTYLEEIDFLTLAQLRLAQGRPAEALRLLTRLRGLAEAQGRGASLVEIYALSALAYRAAGDHAAATATTTTVLRLAAPEGYMRTFVDLGAPMRAQLAAWRSGPAGRDETLAAYADRVLAAYPGPAPTTPRGSPSVARPPAPGLLPDPLTPRELEVLGWISEGLSNEQIADKLVVGVSTVKKHINNLYAKLEVTSRTQALKRARELGIID